MEIFKDISGYEGEYQASNLGRIKSLERYINHWRGGKRIIKERILKHGKNNDGYLHLHLSCKVNNTFGIHRKTFSIHRLIAQTFISNPKNKPQINHKNGNSLKNG